MPENSVCQEENNEKIVKRKWFSYEQRVTEREREREYTNENNNEALTSV